MGMIGEVKGVLTCFIRLSDNRIERRLMGLSYRSGEAMSVITIVLGTVGHEKYIGVVTSSTMVFVDGCIPQRSKTEPEYN